MQLVREHAAEVTSNRKAAKACGRGCASSAPAQPLLGLISDDDLPAREYVSSGELTVRRELRADTVILWLGGQLDCVTSALLERELNIIGLGSVRVVVDLTGLGRIDSAGAGVLVDAHRRAGGSGHPLCLRGRRVVQRLHELTNGFESESWLASRLTAAKIERNYFALALACADVDHLRPQSDRPRGISDLSPDPAAGASGVSSLSGAALAAPPRARRQPDEKDAPRIIRLPIAAGDDHAPAA